MTTILRATDYKPGEDTKPAGDGARHDETTKPDEKDKGEGARKSSSQFCQLPSELFSKSVEAPPISTNESQARTPYPALARCGRDSSE
eukprot:scaffold419910_cov24-Prasinocladus_malaysianus.AAC.1